MRVLDARFLIDHLEGEDTGADEYLRRHEDDVDDWIVPSVNFAEVLVGAGFHPEVDVQKTRRKLDWVDVVEVDEMTAILAGEIQEEIGPQGPALDGPDAIAAAVSRQTGAPVVTGDGDLTHQATQQVVDVETY